MSSLFTSLPEHVCVHPLLPPSLSLALSAEGIVTSHIVCRRAPDPSLSHSPLFLSLTSLPVSPTSIQQQLARSHGVTQLPLSVSLFPLSLPFSSCLTPNNTQAEWKNDDK